MEISRNATDNEGKTTLTEITEKYKQTIPREITPTTPNTESRSNSLRYPDMTLWEKSIDFDLEKIDENETVQSLAPAQLKTVGQNTRLIPMTLTFNYKRNNDGSIEEHK